MVALRQSLRKTLPTAGFTLIELILVLAVISILLSVALPDLRGVMARNQLIGQANELAGALSLARSEAVTRGVQTGFCVSTDGETCGWPADADDEYFLLVFVDENSNFNRTDDLDPLKVLPGSPEVGFSLGGNGAEPPDALYFNPSGFSNNNANASMEVCHKEGSELEVSDRCRSIVVSPTGSVAVRQHHVEPT